MKQLNEQLLKDQDEWLRRMARHLVGSTGAGDDLAQDTWVAGIEAGAARMTLRPWLFRVLSNKASGSRSGERRTEDVLRMVQREGRHEGSAPDDAIADLELRERLLQELKALDEPLRTAIHQVYFLGLSMREAGKVLGVSRSTVSERTQKGLDELRGRLDQAYGGDRKTWATLLAPAIARGASLGVGAAAIHGGVVTGPMKIAGAAALLAGVGWLASTALTEPGWKAADPGASETLAPSYAMAEPREPVELAAVSSVGHPVTRTPVSNSAQVSQDATVTARFLRPGGEPAAGASWRLRGSGANKERVKQYGLPENWEDPRGTLDADGNLVLSFAPPQAMQFTLSVWDEGVVTEGWRWGHVRHDESRELGTIQLLEACEVRGFVVDEADQIILGRSAWVYAKEAAPAQGGGRKVREQMVQLDPATGSFVLDAVPAGKVLLSASGALRTRAPEPVEVELGSIRDVRLAMDPQSYEEGQLEVSARMGAFSFRGAPIPLECVWLEGAEGLQIAAAGYRPGPRKYRFEGIPDGPLALVAEHPAIEPVRIEQVQAVSGPSFDLIGRSSIVWSVTGPGGANVDQYSIEMVRRDSGLRTPVPILYDGLSPLLGGELGGLWPGTYSFAIRTSGGAATIEVENLEVAEARPVAVTLAPTVSVTGRLIRSNGDPVRGETIRLMQPAEVNDSEHSDLTLYPSAAGVPLTSRRCVQRILSDGVGRFEFVADSPGRYLVLAGGETRPFVWSEPLDLVGGTVHGPVILTLEEPSGLRGRFTPPGHLPQTGWLIQLHTTQPESGGGLSFDNVAVDIEGRFAIPSLADGRYGLYATTKETPTLIGEELRPHGAYFLRDVDVQAGQDADAPDLRIQAPIPAQVQVILQSEDDLEGRIHVAFRPLGIEGAWMTSHTTGTATGIQPVILEPGSYEVSFIGEGWRGFDPREISIPENQAVSITVPLDVSTHRVRLMRGGEPLRNVRVTLSSPANESHRKFASRAYDVDADGWLEARLSSGTWGLFVVEENAAGAALPAVDFAWPPAAQDFEF